jgi:bifunctional non-homologous end joining protein LigD
MFLQFQPMPLLKRPLPFDDPEWLFELKYDGFRALALIEHGHAQLLSRNGHTFASFADLAKNIATSIPSTRMTVLDGEIVCVDRKGKPQFRDLLFHRGDPCFFAFDLLTLDGKDCRMERLIDRKQELRRLLEMAHIFGIDRGHISDIERGKKNVCLPMLEILSKGFAISISKLMRGI